MRGLVLFLTVTSLVLAAETSGYDRALDLYNRTDYRGAIAALKDEPDSRSLVLLGRSYFMNADYRKAAGALEKAAALDPNDSMTILWLGRAYGRRAETAFPMGAIGWASKARQAFEKAVQLDPSNAGAVDDLFDFYIQAPGVLGGGFDKARGLIPTIAKSDPAEADFARARLAEEKKDFSTAEALLRKAMELAPSQVGRVLDLAKFLARQGRFDESEKLFEKAGRTAPNSPKILFAKAEAYIDAKRNPQQARDLLNRYLASTNLTPDDPPRSDAIELLKRTAGI